jgi:hypothetical protein
MPALARTLRRKVERYRSAGRFLAKPLEQISIRIDERGLDRVPPISTPMAMGLFCAAIFS